MCESDSRLRGEVAAPGSALARLSATGEGLPPRIRLQVVSVDRGPSPQPSPRKRGERGKQAAL
jgi:hypothetical protein